MTRPRPTPRVSDADVARLIEGGYAGTPPSPYKLALDLRDARNEIARLNGQTQFDAGAEEAARWREIAQELAAVLCREDIYSGLSPREFVRTRVSGIRLGPETDAAIARFDAAVKESGPSSMVPVADANAAITKLQRELARKERDRG